MDFNTFLKKLFRQSLEALSPTKAVQEKVTVEEGQIQIAARSFELDDDTSVYLLSVGKAGKGNSMLSIACFVIKKI